MTVLVLGGAGFIGSHCVDALLSAGVAVRVFDRSPERFRPVPAGVDMRTGSIGDADAVAAAMEGATAVMHLVSTTVPGTAERSPETDVAENLIGTLRILGAMKAAGVRRLLYLSSGGAVYGIPEQVPIPEDHPLRPIGSYGIVKVASEHYIASRMRAGEISAAVLRPSNPYGPRQGNAGIQGVISTFLRRHRDGLPLEIWGDGSVVRDYLDVKDLARLAVRVLLSDAQGTWNAGSGIGLSLNEIIDMVGRITGRTPTVVRRPGRPVDVPRSVLDCSRARQDFGWSAEVSLSDGMASTWTWLQEEKLLASAAVAGPVRSPRQGAPVSHV